MEFLFSIVGHRFTIGLKGAINSSFKLTSEIHKILQDNKNILTYSLQYLTVWLNRAVEKDGFEKGAERSARNEQ